MVTGLLCLLKLLHEEPIIKRISCLFHIMLWNYLFIDRTKIWISHKLIIMKSTLFKLSTRMMYVYLNSGNDILKMVCMLIPRAWFWYPANDDILVPLGCVWLYEHGGIKLYWSCLKMWRCARYLSLILVDLHDLYSVPVTWFSLLQYYLSGC